MRYINKINCFLWFQLLADLFLPFGFVTLTQDMRGAAQSEGNFTLWHADADDSFDTGNWIVQQVRYHVLSIPGFL
jgi:predicted acyl esterase